MTRQLAYQKRNRALGLCLHCPQPAFKAGRCIKHYEQHLKAQKRDKVVACCGEVGRLKVQLYRKLKLIAESDQSTEVERFEAQVFLELFEPKMEAKG